MEQLLKTHQFSAGGKDYEVRVVADEKEIRARVFLEGEPARQFPSIGMTWETQSDFAACYNVDDIKALSDGLVGMAETFVREHVHYPPIQDEQP